MLIAGIPLALASWVGLVMLVPFISHGCWRGSLDEERVLVAELPGYCGVSSARTRYRLIPGVW